MSAAKIIRAALDARTEEDAMVVDELLGAAGAPFYRPVGD
jgi:hypothetical protein